MRLLALLALLAAAPALAQDVPGLVPHQGRLVDASAPVDGTFSTRFALYRAETGGTPAWSETRSVTFDNGYYGVNLGEAVPIPASLFDGADLWLGVRVGSAAELPRIRVAAAPYAARAGVASNVDGDITPNSISINGTTVINAAGQWVGATEGLQGPPGEDADPAEVATALSASSGFVSTVATNLATSHAAALRGPQGVQGPQGPQGPQGNPGSPDSGADILSKLAQVDGSGSGLDADLLDGLSATALIDAAADEVLVNLPPIGGIEGADQTVAILVRATGSGTVGATRSIQIAGAEAITFSNSDGLALVVVDRETYDVVTSVNSVTVTRNFDVNNASTGLIQWATFIDAVSQLRYADHLAVLASRGPIDRYLHTSINGGPTPAEVLDGLGADLDTFDLGPTDAFALIGYPDVGAGNGLALTVDTSASTNPSADLAGIVMDGFLAGADSRDDESRSVRAIAELLSPTSCPSGMVLVNGGTEAAFCVETGERSARRYLAAQADCMDEGRHVCTKAQWYAASQIPGGGGLTGMCNHNWEWVGTQDDAHSGGHLHDMMGNGACDYITWGWSGYGNNQENRPYRCCTGGLSSILE